MSSKVIGLVCLAALTAGVAASRGQTVTAGTGVLSRVDHLVYATPDLALGIETAEKLFGVRATMGGQHPGEGTRNALIALGPATYFEIIGPDPEQPKPARGRRFGIDEIKAPRLTTWVAKGQDLEMFAAGAAAHGVNLGAVIPGSRKRPDGVVLSWRYTDPRVVLADRLVPYFIDWGASPHPSATAAKGVTLLGLRGEHPDADRVQQMMRQLGLDLTVTKGPKPALIATLDGPKGRVQLTSER
jgi:hypothetical protein